MWRTTSYFIIIVLVVVSTSVLSSRLWSGEQEQLPERIAVTEFGKKYHLDRKSLKKIFAITFPDDLKKQVADFGMNEELLSKKVNQAQAIQSEHESKNWFKIPLKGLLWIFFLLAVFSLIRKGRITARNRKWIYMAGVGVFGIILGSDPARKTSKTSGWKI